LISGGLSLIAVLAAVGLFARDQMAKPEDRRISDASLQAIRTVLTTPNQNLTVAAKEEGAKPSVTEKEKFDKQAENVTAAAPAAEERRAEGRSGETAQLEIAFLTDLKKGIEQDMAELDQKRAAFDAERKKYEVERERDKAQAAQMAGSTMMKLIK
jgi:hypothetical protein